MNGLVIWAQIKCRSVMELYRQMAVALKVPLLVPIWHEKPLGAENAVSVHIRHLRQKLEIDPSQPRYLKVVWGLGYKLEGGREG